MAWRQQHAPTEVPRMRLGIVRCLPLSLVVAVGCGPARGAHSDRHLDSRRTAEKGQGSWPRGNVVINEVYPGQHKLSGWIELASRCHAAVDLSGWFLTDKTDRLDHYYQFPTGSRIEPGARLLVRADGGQDGLGHHAPFSLSRSDSVYLLNR